VIRLSSPTQPRVLVECTHTYLVGGSTGIRRVARALANAGIDGLADNVRLSPIVWGGSRFFGTDHPIGEHPHPLYRWFLQCHSLLAGVHRMLGGLSAAIDRFGLQRWRPVLRWVFGIGVGVLRVLMAPILWWLKRVATRLPKATLWRDGNYRLLGLLARLRCLPALKTERLRAGDIVVLVDSTWDSAGMLRYLLKDCRERGVVVGVMLHDLFPLTLPHLCQAQTVTVYSIWFHRMIGEVDFVMTNSQATSRALDQYLGMHPTLRWRPLPRCHFRIGADLPMSDAPSGPDVSPIAHLQGFVVLVVGTLEPRKNHDVILDALDGLWADTVEHPVHLVIVGRHGWQTDALCQRIGTHPRFGTQLLHLDNLDDAALAGVYRRADTLVCASWDEGFGLPIVEGLRFGLPIVASDIPVFREVGGDACHYFPPDSPCRLGDILHTLLVAWASGHPLRTTAVTRAISWTDSALDFYRVARELAAAADHRAGTRLI
jgi:glycosyltransferase involved in cell wall biosynthesis